MYDSRRSSRHRSYYIFITILRAKLPSLAIFSARVVACAMRAEVEEEDKAVLVADRSMLPVTSFVAASAMF